MGVFNLSEQLGFYGAYHSKTGNILVHVVFVPLIFYTAQYIFAYAFPAPASFAGLSHDIHVPLPGLDQIPFRFELGGSTIAAAGYLAYYLVLEPVAALLYLPFMLAPMVLNSTALAVHSPRLLPLMIGLHVLSWVAQIASHGLIEGRAPALLENLSGALVLAPFFTWLEMLFFFGYRPELHKEIINSSSKKIVELNKAKRDAKKVN